jgi:hypothetical protein
MQHTKTFFIFFCQKTQSQLLTIKVNKPHISQILKALINQLLNPKKHVETCSIFTGNTTDFICPSILDHIQIKTLNSFFFLFDFIIQ